MVTNRKAYKSKICDSTTMKKAILALTIPAIMATTAIAGINREIGNLEQSLFQNSTKVQIRTLEGVTYNSIQVEHDNYNIGISFGDYLYTEKSPDEVVIRVYDNQNNDIYVIHDHSKPGLRTNDRDRFYQLDSLGNLTQMPITKEKQEKFNQILLEILQQANMSQDQGH